MLYFPILELLQDCEDPPLTSESLQALQKELGIRFPQQYADFLLQFNGGYFHRHVMFFVHEPTPWLNTVGIASFYGVSKSWNDGCDLRWIVQNYVDRVPDEYMPIADCKGLDMILITIDESSRDFGKVWFWDGTEEGEGGNIHWLADSFNEFLSMLQYDISYYEDEEDQETDPLFLAIEHGKRKSVEQFLAEAGHVETRNAQGHTLLIAAVRYSWPKIVRLLLEHSADPNARDNQGRTPLHHAATSSIDSIKLLLAAGADAKARDNEGKRVLNDWSYRANQILRAHGAEE